MFFSVLTLFPELVTTMVRESITGRALEADLFAFRTHNIRDYAHNDYGKVDDTLYGGGRGMLMMCQPIFESWEAAKTDCDVESDSRLTVYLSPKGHVLNQALVEKLASYNHLILLCGHYEGVDQRVLDEMEVQEISIGDYVLTGGELAAGVLIDAVARQLPGVLPTPDAVRQESHFNCQLEYRQYTKPAVWKGREVPPVLLSGHHKNIDKWRQLDGIRETMLKRPDLFQSLKFDENIAKEFVKYCRDMELDS
ncbi:MAG: tRNA (guanosine(37)-N1)-methyltransferase TrmD [Fastidiosipilaceae bacterium]|nr:tRNA (guanosine(37)-N1)-methyltransferase TrmD [Clostridiaceae bacterium]